MDKITRAAFEEEFTYIVKEAIDPSAVVDTISSGVQWLHNNPGTAAALAAAKVNLMNRYGQHIPGVRHVMGKFYQGVSHAGLQAGLAGEKMISAPTRFLASAIDSNTPTMYERAHAIGNTLRAKGVTGLDGAASHLSDLKSVAKDTGVAVPEAHAKFVKGTVAKTPFNRFARAASGPITNFAKNIRG